MSQLIFGGAEDINVAGMSPWVDFRVGAAERLAPGGLLVLASGKRLYRTVDPHAFVEQGESERGFWVWFAEIMSSHPRLPRRIQALEDPQVRSELLAKAA